MTSGFRLVACCGRARAGLLQTAHGPIETPVFMPVGTQATVKALAPTDLQALGVEIVLANAYHIALRPGADVVRAMGGLHRFMGWRRAIITDSGGYQVFSLRGRRTVDDDGVTFQSHIDGSAQRFTPESVMAIQASLGSDVAMAFDECPAADAPPEAVRAAMERTTRWARRCLESERSPGQLRFAIVQGGSDLALRARHVEELAALPFEGLALGGLSVGESREVTLRVVEAVAPLLPAERPRYLMGVGTPADLLAGIASGMDMFDCVLPTRNARNGQLFVRGGHVAIANAAHRDDQRPVEEGCPCEACRGFSRAYLSHLYHARELLYHRLATLHNLQHFVDLVRGARQAIITGNLDAYIARRSGFAATGMP